MLKINEKEVKLFDICLVVNNNNTYFKQYGVVVEVIKTNPNSFCVEFSDQNGETQGIEYFKKKDFVHFTPNEKFLDLFNLYFATKIEGKNAVNLEKIKEQKKHDKLIDLLVSFGYEIQHINADSYMIKQVYDIKLFKYLLGYLVSEYINNL